MKALLGIVFSLLFIPVAFAESTRGTVMLTNVPEGSVAADPSVKIYKYTNKSGVPSFSDRAPANTRYEVVQLSCYACNLRSTVNWDNTPLYLQAFAGSIEAAAQRFGVDPALVRAVIHAESAFKPGAISRKGAQGLMQLMPDTARDMGVSNALSPDENIHGGVRYLAWLLEQNGGNTTLATAAYNAGPGAVQRAGGIPPYEETQTYVKRVRILHQRYQQAMADPGSSGSGRQIAKGSVRRTTAIAGY